MCHKKSKADRENPYPNLVAQLNILAGGLLRSQVLSRARKVVRKFFTSNVMILKFNSEIGNFGTLLRSFQLRVIRNMKRRKSCYEQFLDGWEEASLRVRQLSSVFPNKRVLGIGKYLQEIQDTNVLEQLFEIIWNSKLLDFLRKRIKTEVYKVSENKSDYTTWRLNLMAKQNYVNEHIGFEKIMHMEGLTRFVESHKWNETYIKALKRVPESLIVDVMGKSSPINLIRSRMSDLAQAGDDSSQPASKGDLVPFKFLVGSPTATPSSRLRPKHSLSLKLAATGLSLKELSKQIEKNANPSPTKARLMDSKFNIAKLLKKSNQLMDLGFSDKFFFNLVIATTLYFLNRDNIPF